MSPAFFKYVSISLYLFEYPLTCVKGVGSTISPTFSGGVSVSPGNSSSDMLSLVPRAREADAWVEGAPTATGGRNGAKPDTDTTVTANSDAHSATCARGARAGRVIGRGPRGFDVWFQAACYSAPSSSGKKQRNTALLWEK